MKRFPEGGESNKKTPPGKGTAHVNPVNEST